MWRDNIHIGTSGWHYKDWKGEYYPAGLKTSEWLPYYTRDFKTTEINNSFYRLPNIETVKCWNDCVPEDFKFSPKFSRYLTQMKKLKDPEDPFKRFFTVFEPMREKLGPVLLQLPPQLPYKEDRLREVLELIRNHYNEFLFALEVRHETWMCEESIALLREYGVAFTISQQGVGWPYAEHLTAKHVYVRFHGPGKLFASPYSDEMMQEYALKFRSWAKKGHEVWVYFNNDWFGYAINNAKTLEGYLKKLR
ncbi:MAG: DUF72 domain-containing protein [Sphingobacteriales bacterium]|nr:MAG: DUF72 domain-containing protein [Sphingobacteriales bacterium]